MEEKIFIGTVKSDVNIPYIKGEKLYLTKHSWDCNWYWGFGYIGNKSLHTHFDNTFLNNHLTYSEIFYKPIHRDYYFKDSDWYVIKDLFIQAYSLQKTAEVYRYGGHQTIRENITDIIKNQDKANIINKDLELVLNTLWDFIITNRIN